jgi:hypothetical protein
MGSYLFSNSSICEVNCEEDVNTLKYLCTKSKEINCNVNIEEREMFHKISEFFKYLHQKFKFSAGLEKLLINIKTNILCDNSLRLFLNIQKHLNKFVFNKKFYTKISAHSGNEMSQNNFNFTEKKSKMSIKILFEDSIYLISDIKSLEKNNDPLFSPQLNYISFFSFTKNYSNRQISEFLLNEKNNDYDHLLPMFLLHENISSLVQNFKHFIKKHNLNNIMLPPLNIKIKEDLNALKNFINQTCLNFLDVSFVIFASELSDIHIQIKSISQNLEIKQQSDYIYRFYLFTKFNNLTNIEEIKKELIKGISLSIPKKDSYIILYLFIPKYVKLYTPYFNPNYSDKICERILKQKDEEDQNKRKTEEWKNRNRNESYNSDIKSHLITKNVLKIYTSTNFIVWSFIYCVYSNESKIKYIKKKPILSTISKFISIRFKEKIFNDLNDPKVKNIVNLSSIQNQEEFKNSYVMYPRKESEIHQDLVYLHFEQTFRLMRYSESD